MSEPSDQDPAGGRRGNISTEVDLLIMERGAPVTSWSSDAFSPGFSSVSFLLRLEEKEP